MNTTDGKSEATQPEPTAQDEVADRRRERVLDVAVGVLVLAAYAIGQFIFLEGPQPFDPAKYFKTAVDFPTVPADKFTLRIGLIAPVRVAVQALGPSEAALYAVPFATGLALAGSVYVTLLVLFRQRVLAAAAALVTVLNTNYLLNASHIFPDTTATATLTAGFLFLVLGGTLVRRGGNEWLARSFVIAAGVLFGWSYLIREFSPMLLPAVAVAVVLLRYPLRRVALLAAAALATAALELVYGLLLYSDPLIHAQKLIGHRGGRELKPEHDSVLDVFLLFPRLLDTWRFGWIFILLVVWFVVALAWFRDRRLWLFAGWLFVFWGFMVAIALASLPRDAWLLNVTNIRYWYPALPPLVMGAFGGLALLAQRFWPGARGALVSSSVSAAFALVVLAPGFVQFDRCAEKDVWTNDPLERWQDLRAWFATGEADGYSVLWTDSRTDRLLPAFTGATFGEQLWAGRVEVFGGGRDRVAPVDPAESLLLIHKERFQWLGSAQATLDGLRAEWTPLFITDDGNMVVLAHESTTTAEPAYASEAWWDVSVVQRPTAEGCGLRPGLSPRRA